MDWHVLQGIRSALSKNPVIISVKCTITSYVWICKLDQIENELVKTLKFSLYLN
jgi:hypothetical protein